MIAQLICSSNEEPQIVLIPENDIEKAMLQKLPTGNYQMYYGTEFTARQGGFMAQSPYAEKQVAFRPVKEEEPKP